MINDKREHDECVTECDGVCATNVNGCNGCSCATNVNRVQQMRNDNRCPKQDATNVNSNRCFTRCNECNMTNTTMGAMDAQSGVHELCLGHSVQLTRIQSGGVREC